MLNAMEHFFDLPLFKSVWILILATLLDRWKQLEQQSPFRHLFALTIVVPKMANKLG